MSDGNSQTKGIGQLRLEFRLPCAAAVTVAAAGIGEDEDLPRDGISKGAFTLPPVRDGVRGKSRRIVRYANHEGSAISCDVVDSVGNRDTCSVSTEVVIEDAAGLSIPASAGIFEIANEFAFFGVDADDGKMPPLKTVTQVGEIFELPVSVGTAGGRDLFVIHAERIAHLIEQARDGIGGDDDTGFEKFFRDSGRGAPRPAQARHGIAGRVVFEQPTNDIDYVGLFFSVDWRPPP